MHTKNFVFGISGTLWLIAASVAFSALVTQSLQARVFDQPKAQSKWIMLDEPTVDSGATIQAGRNVFFRIPADVDSIDRETLLGLRGYSVRYWGYCLPEEDDPGNLKQSTGLPGKMFLSEAEREWRKVREVRLNPFSPVQIFTKKPQKGSELVRHQIDTFRGGMTCFIMTERELPIGLDQDGDGLNNKLEGQFGTDPLEEDSDGDGLGDGNEIRYGTNPQRRDSDGDGLLDGIEDKNHNARLEPGETDPRKLDTDGDGLCDGFCHENKVRRTCKDNKGSQCVDVPYGMQMGEDKNLNGKVDSNESDPTKQDSKGDGLRDDVRFFKCLAEGKTSC